MSDPSRAHGAVQGAALLTHRPPGCSDAYDSWAGKNPLAVLDDTCRVDAAGLPVAGSWFSTRQVADGITLITEPHVDSLIRANFYHVCGSEADLVVDTGTGIAPLAWVLGGLIGVGQRVIAIATHTHYDHVGGMHEFRERLVHLRERESLAGEGQFASLLARDFPMAWRSQVEDDDHQLPDVLVATIPFEGFDPEDLLAACPSGRDPAGG